VFRNLHGKSEAVADAMVAVAGIRCRPMRRSRSRRTPGSFDITHKQVFLRFKKCGSLTPSEMRG
jgi:hypothetical protein